jgi:tRNA pseudouridine55 synthase
LPQAGRVRVYRQADNCLLGTAQLADYGVLAPERLVKT